MFSEKLLINKMFLVKNNRMDKYQKDKIWLVQNTMSKDPWQVHNMMPREIWFPQNTMVKDLRMASNMMPMEN
jgi:hypothetical protein